MNDYIHVENGLRVHVWETNKGYSLGLFKWRVWRWDSETEMWIAIYGDTTPRTYDDALSQAKYYYERADAKRQAQQVYVTPENKARLMRDYGLTEEDFYSDEGES